MAKATFVQEGTAIDYTPGADVGAGDIVVQNDLVGIAKRDIKANVLGAKGVGELAGQCRRVRLSQGDRCKHRDRRGREVVLRLRRAGRHGHGRHQQADRQDRCSCG